MSTLYFNVEADFEEVIRLKKEIERLKAELVKPHTNDIIEGLQLQLKACKRNFDELVNKAALAGTSIRGSFGEQIAKAGDRVYLLSENIRYQKEDVEKATLALKRYEEELKRLQSANAPSASIQMSKGRIANAKSNLGNAKERLAGYESDFKAESEKISILENAVTRYGVSAAKSATGSKLASQAIAEIGVSGASSAVKMEESCAITEEVCRRLSDRIAGVGSALGIATAAGSFVQQMTTVRGQFEQTEIALSVMLGSETKAMNLVNQLADTAAKTPFDFQGITESAKQLIAYGTDVEKVNEKLLKLGDIAAATSQPLSSLVYLYGTTMTQGKMMTMDLRQFQNRGVPLADEIAKQLNIQKNEVAAAVTAGKVTADVFDKAIMGLAEGKYNNLMLRQSDSIQGKISNIEDQVDLMFNEIGKKATPYINNVLDIGGVIIDNWKTLAKVIGTAVASYGAYKAALMATIAIERSRATFQDKAKSAFLSDEIEKARKQLDSTGMANDPEVVSLKEKIKLQTEELALLQAKIKVKNDFEAMEAASLNKVAEAGRVARESNVYDGADIYQELDNAQNSGIDEYVDLLNKQIDAENRLKAAQEDALAPYQDLVDEAQERVNSLLEEYEGLDLMTDGEEAVEKAKELNVAQTQLETAQENLNTMEKRVNTAATTGQTVATNVNTTATGANTASLTQMTIAQRVHAITTKAGTIATGLFRAMVGQLTASFKRLTAAIASNPIGFILSIIPMAISVIASLTDETDEAAQASEKFGEAAVKTMNNISSLYAIINTAKVGSKAYEDAMSQLVAISKEHGIVIDEEGNKIDQLNEKRSELIQLIRREGEERQYANTIQTINEDYDAEIEKIKADILDGLDDVEGTVANTYADLITQNLAANADKMNKLWNEFTSFNTSGNLKAAQAALAEYNKLFDQSVVSVQRAAKANGESASTIKSIREAADDVLPAIRKAKEEQNASADAAERVHRENAKATDSLNGLSSATARSNRQAELAKKTVGQLGEVIAQLTKDYGDNVINFRVQLQTQGLPDWLKKQLNIGNATEKDVQNAQTNAAYWISALGQMDRTGAKVFKRKQSDGKWVEYTREEVAKNAMTYQYGAEQAQADVDARKKKQEEEEAAKKKAKPKPRKSGGKSPAELEAERQRKIEAENRAYAEEEAKRRREYAYQAEQEEIDDMEESTEKRLRQLQLDHKKTLDEISDEAESIKAARVKHAEALFYANERNKDKDFHKTFAYEVATILTDEDEAYIKSKVNAATTEYNKKMQSELINSLVEYQTFKERQLEIDKRYEEEMSNLYDLYKGGKITKEDYEAYVDNLKKKNKEELKALADELAKTTYSEKLGDYFSKASLHAGRGLKDIIRETGKLIKLLKDPSLKTKGGNPFDLTDEEIKNIKASPEQIDEIIKKYKELQEAVKSNPFKQFANDIKNLFGSKGDEVLRFTKRVENLVASLSNVAGIASSLLGRTANIFGAGENTRQEAFFNVLAKTFEGVAKIADSFSKGMTEGFLALAEVVLDAAAERAERKQERKRIRSEIAKAKEQVSRLYKAALYEKSVENTNTILGESEYNSAMKYVKLYNDALKDLQNQLYKLNDIQILTGVEERCKTNEKQFSSLLSQYPDLIKADGTFNKELAESIISSREFKDEGGQVLQGLVDTYNVYEEALGKLREYLSSVFGALGNTLTDTLVNAFKNGTDAGKKFAESVSEMIENLAKQMMYSLIFNDLFEKASKDIENVYANLLLTEDEKYDQILGILDKLFGDVESKEDEAYKYMQSVQDKAAEHGFSIFGNNANQEGEQRGFASMTQDTAEELNGRFTALQIAGESANSHLGIISATAEQIANACNQQANIATGILDMIASSYLSLQQITENTGAIIKPIQEMKEDIGKMKTSLERL